MKDFLDLESLPTGGFCRDRGGRVFRIAEIIEPAPFKEIVRLETAGGSFFDRPRELFDNLFTLAPDLNDFPQTDNRETKTEKILKRADAVLSELATDLKESKLLPVLRFDINRKTKQPARQIPPVKTGNLFNSIRPEMFDAEKTFNDVLESAKRRRGKSRK